MRRYGDITPDSPMGLGDPDDRKLRKVEKDVLIAGKVRDRARLEKCIPEVAAFNECCKASGVSMVYHCRPQTKDLRDCLTKWYHDTEFVKECTEQYLHERSEYRRTGIKTKHRKNQVSTESADM